MKKRFWTQKSCLPFFWRHSANLVSIYPHLPDSSPSQNRAAFSWPVCVKMVARLCTIRKVVLLTFFLAILYAFSSLYVWNVLNSGGGYSTNWNKMTNSCQHDGVIDRVLNRMVSGECKSKALDVFCSLQNGGQELWAKRVASKCPLWGKFWRSDFWLNHKISFSFL